MERALRRLQGRTGTSWGEIAGRGGGKGLTKSIHTMLERNQGRRGREASAEMRSRGKPFQWEKKQNRVAGERDIEAYSEKETSGNGLLRRRDADPNERSVRNRQLGKQVQKPIVVNLVPTGKACRHKKEMASIVYPKKEDNEKEILIKQIRGAEAERRRGGNETDAKKKKRKNI